MVLTIHHLENSQSLRVVWLLEELGVDYELKLYKRDPETQLAPPELKAISPLGTSPAISDGDVCLCETNAIIDYILDYSVQNSDQEAIFRPPKTDPAHVDYLFFFHAGQGSLYPALFLDSVWKIVIDQVPCPISSLLKFIHGKLQETLTGPRIAEFMDLVETKLSSRDFIAAGHLTAADITLIYPMERALEDKSMRVKYPKCQAWLDRVHNREAHKRALKKVGETKKK